VITATLPSSFPTTTPSDFHVDVTYTDLCA
jgi:hypothetical protein